MDQDEIIHRLSLGEGFDGIPPERIDTHISTIFLVGDDVFKLKRELATSYLDYSTLENRRRFCNAELNINRRTAPQIYLDVVPVRQSSADKLVVGDGQGPPIEWLVHMRRFAQENLFDNLAEAGLLSPALLTELADEIAAFHQTAEIVKDPDAARRIVYVLEQNTRELEDKATGIIDRSLINLFDESCRSIFDKSESVINRRGTQGFVRHCHGDLHLRNICLIEGKPTLFDAIEFSDDIRQIDVLFDLAFLVMDLEHRGLRNAANIVFNRYLYRTGDVDDLSVFPLYLALRAGIRAHVSAMAAPTQKIAQDREKLQRDTQSYFHLGLHQLERSSPQLIAIGGLSGTGKSTVAREIAPHLGLAPGALVLGSDLIRKKLLGTEPLTRLTEAAYNSETDRVVYGELMKIAMKGLESGYSVVLDATFIDPIQRQKLKDIAQNAGIQLLGFWLEASAMTLRSRLQKRVDDPSDATNSVLERQLETDVGEIDWQRIDATQDCTAISAALLRAVNTGVSSPDGKEEKMSLMCVRVEPARDLEIADGPPYDTYEFTIPLDSDGHLDLTHWEEVAEYCTIKRFRRNASVLHGHLIKNDRGEWAISYEAGENDDEFIYRIASQVFRTGEVLSITQNDETDHLFRVTSVTRPLIFGT